jgi:hypothetical protein
VVTLPVVDIAVGKGATFVVVQFDNNSTGKAAATTIIILLYNFIFFIA